MVCSSILTAITANFVAAAYTCMYAMASRCIAATTRHEKVQNITGSATI